MMPNDRYPGLVATAIYPGSRIGRRINSEGVAAIRMAQPSYSSCQIPFEPEKNVTIWYDPEGDSLEVFFDRMPGYFRETENDQVMEKVDAQGNILRFSVLKISSLKLHPLEVAVSPKFRPPTLIPPLSIAAEC